MSERDQVEDWDDIDNVKTMYRLMRADRDGWKNLYFKSVTTESRLYLAIILMTIPAIVGITEGILWLIHHMSVHFT